MNRLVFLFFIILCASLNAQNYTYSYTDPCTKTIKTLSVPMNGTVTVAYYGSIGVFSYNDFTTGVFETWTNSVFTQFSGANPCGSIVGNSTIANITQGQVINTLGILNSLAAIADIASGTTNMLGGSLNAIASTPTIESPKSSSSNSNTTSSKTSNSTPYNLSISLNSNSNGNNSNSILGGSGSISSASSKPPGINIKISSPTSTSTTSSPKSSFTFSSKPGSGAVASNSGGKTESSPTVETPKEEGKTNITAGGTTTVKASGGSSNSNRSKSAKDGGKPVVVGSGDFVGFNFNNSEVSNGIKATGGYTSMRWDGKVSSGVMVDYTSAQIGPNITGFYALMNKRAVTLLSSTATISFAGAGSLYGTFAFGQMRSFKKIKPLKVVYMGTVSFGHVYKEMFLGTAVIGGGSYDLKVHKRLDLKFMGLAVFVPYMSYYQDVVVKSPIVLIPSMGANIGISKRFKLNVNVGSTIQSGSALNYTVTTGTRLIL